MFSSKKKSSKRQRKNTPSCCSQMDIQTRVGDKCSESIDNDMIECFMCNSFFHAACVNISRQRLAIMESVSEDAKYICTNCRNGKKNVECNPKIESLDRRITRMNDIISDITKAVTENSNPSPTNLHVCNKY